MRNIKRYFLYTLLAVFSMFTITTAAPVTDMAAAKCTGSRVLTFPTWYNGMPGTCANPKITQLNDFWIIVMNFIEILLQLVAYVAVGYIIWGGFKYIKSEGDPSKISEAKSAVMNAVIGLVIALASVAIVQFVQGSIVQS